MNRADFQQLAELRIHEAEMLLNNGYYAGAYYLAGYAVECALKACIAKLTNQDDFPDKKRAVRSHTHNLTELLDVALLKTYFDGERTTNKAFDANWNVVKGWSEEARYNINISGSLAMELYSAIADPSDGVLQWLKKYW